MSVARAAAGSKSHGASTAARLVAMCHVVDEYASFSAEKTPRSGHLRKKVIGHLEQIVLQVVRAPQRSTEARKRCKMVQNIARVFHANDETISKLKARMARRYSKMRK